MTSIETVFQSRSVRALVLMHEESLRAFLPLWRSARESGVALPESDSEDYRSLEHLLLHVLRSAGRYLERMAEHLRLPPPRLPAVPGVRDVARDADAYVDDLLRAYRATLAGVQDAGLEPEVYTPGMHYWLDAMLEHAAFHPLRHAFQLRELMVAHGPAETRKRG